MTRRVTNLGYFLHKPEVFMTSLMQVQPVQSSYAYISIPVGVIQSKLASDSCSLFCPHQLAASYAKQAAYEEEVKNNYLKSAEWNKKEAADYYAKIPIK